MIKLGCEVKFNREGLERRKQSIRRQGRQIVIMHALGAAAALYEVYPVGPPHTDDTPHTRDTFKIAVDGEVIAEQGSFWTTSALGADSEGDSFVVAFYAAGAAFFVEWGTIFMEARPIIRMAIKMARADIVNDLRKINSSSGI